MAFEPPIIPGYEILGELGSGGMADVFLAVQTALDRRVAVKVMKRRGDDLESMEKRFLAEARTLARLSHPNVVAIYDISRSADVTYFAMELLNGGTLLDRMVAGIQLGEALSVVVQVANALEVAHKTSIVHRDLKPSNIMFRGEHTPVITDFGVAKRSDQAHLTRLTQTGIMVGTPTYMSPEQINAIDIDGRSDQYSLGVMFFELLNGKPPFDAQTPIALLMAHLNTPMPDLPLDFKAFEPILRRMLEKDPANRFPSMAAFTDELRALLVSDESLLGELRAHTTEQSASEQMRALGFSVSKTSSPQMNFDPSPSNSPSRRVGGVMVRSQSTPRAVVAPAQITVASSRKPAAVAPVSAIAAALVTPTRPRWLIPVVAISAVLLIGVLLWLTLRSSTLDSGTRLLLDASLKQADTYLSKGQLVEPADESAIAVLSAIYAQAPDYPPVQLRVRVLGDALGLEVKRLIGKRQYSNADTLIARALMFEPLKVEAAALRAELLRAQETAALQDRIGALVQRADEQAALGRLINQPPEDAYGLLLQALALSPQDAILIARRDALRKRVLDPIRARLAANDLPGAQALLAQAASRMNAGRDWQLLEAEVKSQLDAQVMGSRVASLLVAARAREAAGQLVEPVGSGAVDAYLAAAALKPNDPQIEAALQAIAKGFLDRAQAALNARDAESALAAASGVRRTKRLLNEISAIEAAAKSALGAQRSLVLERLASAQQASADGRFFGSERGAFELLNEVLKSDPKNPAAGPLLKALPEAIAAAARRQLELKQAPAARTLLQEALQRFPAQPTLIKALSQVTENISADTRAATLLDARTKFQQILDNPPLSEASIARATTELKRIAELDPTAADLARLAAQANERLLMAIAAATDPNTVERWRRSAATFHLAFPKAADPRIETALNARSLALVQIEQASLKASMGELLIDSSPWGTVTRVEDASGKAIALPSDATTPLRISLPQGRYSISVTSPSASAPLRVSAAVLAKQSAKVLARNEAIGSDAYLKAVGWQP